MKPFKTLAVLFLAVLLSACATDTSAQQQQYALYLQTIAELKKNPPPLVEIKALPGQQITGLASITVHAPGSDDKQMIAPPPPPEPSQWAKTIDRLIGVAGSVAGYHYASKAALGIASEIRQAGTAGYQYVQAPAANVTTTTTTNDSHNVDSRDMSTTTSTTTSSTTTTTSTVGDNSGANSGNSGRIVQGNNTESTATPTVVTQPAPVVVTQPAPVIVP